MKSKHWTIFLVVLLLGSNAYWLYVVLDEGISYTYLQSSYEMSETMLAETTRLANLELIGMPADEAIVRIGDDANGFSPFEKEGCIVTANVCVRLDQNRIVIGIGEDDQ